MKKVERYHTKGKVWSGVTTIWTIENSYPVIFSFTKLNKRKATKIIWTFEFTALYARITHNKLLHVRNVITNFAFKEGTRDYLTVYKLVMIQNQNLKILFSPRKKILFRGFNKEQLLLGRFQIFREVIRIPMVQILRHSLLIFTCSCMNLDD